MKSFRATTIGLVFIGVLAVFASSADAKHRHRSHLRRAVIVEEQNWAPEPDGQGAQEWMGHFSGGRNLAPGADPIPLDWVDEQAVFLSERDCRRWINDMKRVYSTYEGYRTCMIYR